MKIDFHVHTKYSADSFSEPAGLAKKAAALGIIPTVTDHNTIAAHADMRRLGAPFIPGEEIRTGSGDLIGLYARECVPKRTGFEEAIDVIHSQGGLAYLPHMFDLSRHGVGRHAAAARVDIIEAYNPRCLSASMNVRAEEFARENNLPMATGSDSHTVWEFGGTYTEMPEFDIENPKALLKALRHAKLHKKGAPFYSRGMAEITSILKKILPK